MKQLLLKPEKCIGCRTCELVCSFGHYGEFNPKLANVKVFEYEKAAVAIPVMCLQCEEASCMKVCPMHAISRDENGAFTINYDRCIGCKMCMNACPLGNISYHPAVKRVFKCDLCGGEPKCAAYCPGEAICYVDTDEPSARRKLVGERYRDLIGEEEKA
ncbi:MAG: 4Fe-4S dicluster domain-containing protein [Oscillospiraceae bacterium]